MTDNNPQTLALLGRSLAALRYDWRGLWARYADRPQGWPDYRRLLDTLNARLDSLTDAPTLPQTFAAAAPAPHAS